MTRDEFKEHWGSVCRLYSVSDQRFLKPALVAQYIAAQIAAGETRNHAVMDIADVVSGARNIFDRMRTVERYLQRHRKSGELE